MPETKYIDLEKGQKAYAIIEVRKNYAVTVSAFTTYEEALEEYEKYKNRTEKFEITELVRK